MTRSYFEAVKKYPSPKLKIEVTEFLEISSLLLNSLEFDPFVVEVLAEASLPLEALEASDAALVIPQLLNLFLPALAESKSGLLTEFLAASRIPRCPA
jgi:hypothetical protein